MDFIKKLQKKPEPEKKRIIWAVLIIISIILIGLWVYVCSRNLSEFKGSDILEKINLPPKENLPNIEIPPQKEDSEELEKMFQELENTPTGEKEGQNE